MPFITNYHKGEMPQWMEHAYKQLLEDVAQLVSQGLPAREGERIIRQEMQRVAQQGPQASSAPASQPLTREQAIQRGAIIPNPERARAIASIGNFDPGNQPRNFTIEEIANRPEQPPYGFGQKAQEARAFLARRAAAYALPEYIENPAYQPQAPQPEIKEREEKHAQEASAIRNAGVPNIPASILRNFDIPEPQRLAPLPPAMISAIQMMNNPAERASYRNDLQEASKITHEGNRRFPTSVGEYMNPYQQRVIDKMREEGLKTFREGIMPALEAKFVRQGQHGGSRHAELARRAARDLEQNILEQQGKALHAGYGQAGELFNADMARQLQAAQQMQNLAGRRQAGMLAEVGGLGDVGRQQQGHEQQGLDIGYQQFLRRRYEPLNLLQQQAAIMHGIPVPEMGSSYQHTPANPALNTMGNLGSLATQLLGARMAGGRKHGGYITGRK